MLLVDADALTTRHSMSVGTLPIGITVPDDRFAYVANMVDDTISVIDISRGAVARTMPAGDDPDGIVFIPSNGSDIGVVRLDGRGSRLLRVFAPRDSPRGHRAFALAAHAVLTHEIRRSTVFRAGCAGS